MGLAFTKETDWVSGPKRHWVGKITFDSSYPTGGEALTASDFGLQVLEDLIINPTLGYVFHWDKTNAKVIAYRSAGSAAALAEVPDTTNLSTVGARAFAIGY